MTNNGIVPGFDDVKDESLKIELQTIAQVENGLLLVLTGYIDTYNSSSFQKRTTKAVEAGFFKLCFDCSALNYVSSTGIGSFTTLLKLVKTTGGDLVLFNLQPKVFEVFQLLGFSQFFNIKDNNSDAVNYFKNGNGQASFSSPFPKVFDCPICGKKLKAVKAGRFRCSECKTILAVDASGQAFLG